jgi:hypothetical protein
LHGVRPYIYAIERQQAVQNPYFARRTIMSAKMPKRDVTGDCEGECRDRVKEGEKDRQVALEKEKVKAPEDYPKAPGAGKRNNPPGDMGGHV